MGNALRTDAELPKIVPSDPDGPSLEQAVRRAQRASDERVRPVGADVLPRRPEQEPKTFGVDTKQELLEILKSLQQGDKLTVERIAEQLELKDVVMDLYTSGVNTESRVVLTHKPTKITVSRTGMSRLKIRDQALEELEQRVAADGRAVYKVTLRTFGR
jgi:glycerol-3-phosphate O-acyltransferase